MSPLSISRFPDELVIEIFRDQCFSTSDLTRLALVSRRFLPSVQRVLYESVKLELAPREAEEEEGPNMAYTVKGWKLLKTLEEHEHLAFLVDEICYMYRWDFEHDVERTSKILTTFETAFATFLHLAPNTTTFTAHDAVPPNDEYLELIARYGKGITELQNPHFRWARRGGPTEATRKITHLTLWQGSESHLGEPAFPNLSHLDYQDENVERIQIRFLDPVFPKLEVLKINVSIAVTLDFSTMPHLHYLHLYNIDSSILCVPDTPNFWYALSRSPSIKTLSFDCLPFGSGFENHIFDYASSMDTIVPSLRTIRFDSQIRLDRAQLILDGRMSTTLTRFVVTSPIAVISREIHPRRQREIRGLVGMCQGTGIEVMLEDEQEQLWDRTCEHLHFSLLPDGSMLIQNLANRNLDCVSRATRNHRFEPKLLCRYRGRCALLSRSTEGWLVSVSLSTIQGVSTEPKRFNLR